MFRFCQRCIEGTAPGEDVLPCTATVCAGGSCAWGRLCCLVCCVSAGRVCSLGQTKGVSLNLPALWELLLPKGGTAEKLSVASTQHLASFTCLLSFTGAW